MISGGIGRVTTLNMKSNNSRALPDDVKQNMQVERCSGGAVDQEDGILGEEKKVDAVENMVMEAKKEQGQPSLKDGGGQQTASAKETSATRQQQPKQQNGIESLPDMTGKIITVSAEETHKLTKERKKKGGRRSSVAAGGDKNMKDRVRGASVSSRTSARQDNHKIEPTDSDQEMMADVEREFQDFIAKLASKKTQSQQGENGAGDKRSQDVYAPVKAGEEGVSARSPSRTETPLANKCTDDSETNDAILQRKSEFISEFTIETMLDNIDDMTQRKSEYTTLEDTDGDNSSRRRKSEYTVDYTIDTWTSSRRRSDEPSLVGQDTAADLESTSITGTGISESLAQDSATNEYDCPSEHAKNSDTNNDTKAGAISSNPHSRISSSHRLSGQQSFHRSSLRRGSSNWSSDKDGQRTPQAGTSNHSISWGTLITMDSERKKKAEKQSKNKSSSSSRHRKRGESKGQLNGSYVSNATADSKASGRSKSSYGSKNSHNSSKKSSSRGDGSKSSSKNQPSVRWKNESSLRSSIDSSSSSNNNKDPEYIRKQATERFERGVHYAERGKYEAARDRFLMALRYRVMNHGGSTSHPDVAAVHEMLGHVYYFLGEEEAADEELLYETEGDEGNDEGNNVAQHNESMLGWDTVLPESNNKSNGKQGSSGSGRKSRGQRYLEKAAMHYQTVLDILLLDSNHSLEEGVKRQQSGFSSLADSSHFFKWLDVAESYNNLGGDEDDKESEDEGMRIFQMELREERTMTIVARVREKLASLPVASPKSYASTSFLCA